MVCPGSAANVSARRNRASSSGAARTLVLGFEPIAARDYQRYHDPVQPPFSVTHVGRGGHILCRTADRELQFPIEMTAGGDFSVWLSGSGLSAIQRAPLVEQLRAWLDQTNR